MRTRKAEASNVVDLVEELAGHPFIANHLLKGCSVNLCRETGSLLYTCLYGCSHRKGPKHPRCNSIIDAHFSVSSLIDKKLFTKAEKEAITKFSREDES